MGTFEYTNSTNIYLKIRIGRIRMNIIKSLIKKNKHLYRVGVYSYERLIILKNFLNKKKNERESKRCLKKISKNPKKEKIKVGFLCQVPENWDKEKKIFDEMVKRDNIEPVILVVPKFDFVNWRCETDYKNNYFCNLYQDAIKMVNSEGSIIDLKQLDFDYIFYQRPYDNYLPKGLESQNIVKIAKICFVPYGYVCAPTYFYINRIHSFFKNVYFNFTDINENYKYSLANYKCNIRRGYQKVEYIGYPEFEDYFDQEKKFEKNILWTPRWTYDIKVGGSHFFEYKEKLKQFKIDNPDINLRIRPHPLMFDNFIRQKQMTYEEVISFKKQLLDYNIQLSVGKTLKEDLLWADILITDFSSIIPMYFVTGKPIIHCDSNYKYTKEIENALFFEYKADNWKEIENNLKRLLKGEDELKVQRKEYINKNYLWHKGAAKRIVDMIEEDGIEI